MALLLGLSRVGVLLVALETLLVLPFGLWLVSLEHVGYDAAWVDAALALLVVALALCAAGGQRPKQARQLAARLAQEADSADAELGRLGGPAYDDCRRACAESGPRRRRR